VEPEHLDFYKDLAAIDAVYGKLVNQTRAKLVFCGDDPGAKRICASRPGAVSYGQCEDNVYRITDVAAENFRSSFRVFKEGELLGAMRLNIPGIHNAVERACGGCPRNRDRASLRHDLCRASKISGSQKTV
jgi:UDP-N-acetylmuramate-alanine ligase